MNSSNKSEIYQFLHYATEHYASTHSSFEISFTHPTTRNTPLYHSFPRNKLFCHSIQMEDPLFSSACGETFRRLITNQNKSCNYIPLAPCIQTKMFAKGSVHCILQNLQESARFIFPVKSVNVIQWPPLKQPLFGRWARCIFGIWKFCWDIAERVCWWLGYIQQEIVIWLPSAYFCLVFENCEPFINEFGCKLCENGIRYYRTCKSSFIVRTLSLVFFSVYTFKMIHFNKYFIDF